MQNEIHDLGFSINYTPTADVEGGDLVVFPDMVAVATTDIPAGETGSCKVMGVFELPKDATACAQGQAVYANANGTITATSDTDTVLAGKAWAEAASGDAFVAVKINV